LPVLLRASRALVSKGFQFRLRIVGDGPERNNLEKLTHDYGLTDRTEFVGSVPPMAIRESLRGVAVIVMPSVCEDVAPLVAIEQMMEGRLLIGSDIGGLGLISNGGGLKFTAGDAEGLASRMRQVIENPSAVPEMGRRCRNHALETFSLDRMVEEHARLYRELMRRKSRVT
jgi:glycosyltransferase involved in cell wall biosynthesis